MSSHNIDINIGLNYELINEINDNMINGLSHSSKSVHELNDVWNQYDCNDEQIEDSEQSKLNFKLIQTIQSEPNLFRLMTASLCPQIYGHEMVKSALVLSLFCGSAKHDKEYKRLSLRAQIHVMIIGEHASGKELLLKAVNAISDKSQYICGNISTLNGLTYDLIKHKNRNRNVVEKGCLASADLGMCCIDEFEKMPALQHQVLQEVMEYQTISLIKRSLVYKMCSRTAIIAAANPINGCYDRSKNVWQNIKVSKSVISKFDLIFVLQDSPDDELDSKVSKDLLLSRRINQSKTEFSDSIERTFDSESIRSHRSDSNLMSKLIYGPEEEPDLIPHSLLRKYVSYAHKYIHPVISSEAKAHLNAFSHQMAKSTQLHSKGRLLELLYRLTESRAKLDLRPIATKEDAFDAIDIVSHSIDKHIIFPSINPMLSSKSSSSKKSKASHLIRALELTAQQNDLNLFSVNDIIEISSKFNIPFHSKEDIITTIHRLNEETLLLKNNSNYKLNI